MKISSLMVYAAIMVSFDIIFIALLIGQIFLIYPYLSKSHPLFALITIINTGIMLGLFLCCFIIRVFTCYSRDKKYYFALVIKVIVVFLGLIQILLVRADVCEDESFMIVYPFLIFVIGGMSLLIGEGLYTVEYDKVNEDNFDNNSKEEKLNEDN